ncbi:MAG: DUF975 family protein [Oscillospiraceae bacterium]
MNLRNTREIKDFASRRLEDSASQKQIVLIYVALALGLTALVTVLNHVLDLQIENFGGLSNLGKKTMLSSVQSMLPLAQSILTMCLDVGYVAAMLRIARGMYTSPQTLRLGFDRFWVLLRCSIFKGLILTGVTFVSMYTGIMIFMLTPLAEPVVEIVTPLMSQMSLLDSAVMIDDATYAQLVRAMLPCFVFGGVMLLILGGPIFYSFRMVNYVIIDKPAMGALMALRESKKMMRGHRLQLLKLDLSLWPYYLASGAALVVCYGDVLLPMLGVELPVSEKVAFFGFYALYMAASFCVHYFLRNRAEVSYALAYDAVKPEEKQSAGVVLGNIFEM